MGTKIMKKPMFKTFSLVCCAEVLPIARVKVAAFAIMYALEKWKQVQREAVHLLKECFNTEFHTWMSFSLKDLLIGCN